MRRVVSLFLPAWPTDRLRRQKGAAAPSRDRPLVTAARDGQRQVLAAVDEVARSAGLRPGLAVAHARATVPDLTVVPAEPEAEARGLARLAVWCVRNFSPIAAPNPPDGLWIDATGCTHLFGGEAAMLSGMVERLERDGISARAAMADTAGAAYAMARFGAAGRKVLVVPPGGQAEALAALPVSALRIPAEAADSLSRLGFETIGRLLNTPRAPLARRFGTDLVRRLDQALGHAEEPIHPVQMPEMIEARQSFPEPIATPEDLRRTAMDLSCALCRDLEAKGLGARKLDLLFHRVDGQVQAIRVGTAKPSRDPAHLARLLAERIETIDPGFGIETVTLRATLAEFLAPDQLVSGLGGEEAEPDLSALLDVLSNRLGPGRLYRMEPVESDVPERSLRRIPPLDPGMVGDMWPYAEVRPARVLSPPEPIEAIALLPDHPPRRFTWRGVLYEVRRADGPERIFGEWWRSSAEIEAVRDYFIVEDETGRRFWLFRRGDGSDPATGPMRWFIHGVFG